MRHRAGSARRASSSSSSATAVEPLGGRGATSHGYGAAAGAETCPTCGRIAAAIHRAHGQPIPADSQVRYVYRSWISHAWHLCAPHFTGQRSIAFADVTYGGLEASLVAATDYLRRALRGTGYQFNEDTGEVEPR